MSAAEDGPSMTPRVPIRDGLLTGDLAQLDGVRLCGTRCRVCGETSLGRNATCPNCGSGTVTEVTLSNQGVLWTFTVVRNRPPGDYKGKVPFVPFGLGLVELPDRNQGHVTAGRRDSKSENRHAAEVSCLRPASRGRRSRRCRFHLCAGRLRRVSCPTSSFSGPGYTLSAGSRTKATKTSAS